VRIDPDTCRDADLLAAEVRRLRAVIAAGEPTLTDEERDTVWTVAEAYAGNDDDPECERLARVLQGIYQRLK
jgi:hypothetical protein